MATPKVKPTVPAKPKVPKDKNPKNGKSTLEKFPRVK